jgi:hypothetical protein
MGFEAGCFIGLLSITFLLLGEAGIWGLLVGAMFAILEAHKNGEL